MLTAQDIRQQFLDFFKSKEHQIVASAPIVVKNDPTLMFTNAGMNQFKDYFLGNGKPISNRIADTQKCLRVSGKHNDLEEVGVDTYHHTMFEMLGNWSFGDTTNAAAGYFKTEAIAWSWEFLTEVLKLDKNRLYVSIFEGDAKENIPKDEEAYNEWKKVIAEDRILLGNKKDNFWEMGDTGPCGPCTEIHVDMRSDAERELTAGATLVNADHPQVIEIWNNVFIQFNRKKDGALEPLPAKHVDTGMGFERLVRVVQGKSSNYDTDIFTPTISATENIVNKKYNFSDTKEDISFRVIADHIRAISFTIADGQLPSNTGAGYVIRRILRRAVRYYFSFLNYKQPLLNQLVPLLAEQFKNVFPELKQQEAFVKKVIVEEENSFLRTLELGLKRIDEYFAQANDAKIIDGNVAFELSDTFGFPYDLTALIATEKNWTVDETGFKLALQAQKTRSQKDAKVDTADWVIVSDSNESKFIGYSNIECTTQVIKYRKVNAKGVDQYQVVLAETPFYAESGGQVGDMGTLNFGKANSIIIVTNTKKENDLIIHFVDTLPQDLGGQVIATIDASRRRKITRHHSVTHLMHSALRQVLGTHVAQKGSMCNEDNLRFDFSHFAKMSDEEIAKVEILVNRKIRQNVPVIIKELPKEEAMKLGAMALFGEKYGDMVRVVIMDENYSIELCGGTHVMNTGELNIFKIITESAVAAGVRRVEALAGCRAETYIMSQLKQLNAIKTEFKNPKDLMAAIKNLQTEKSNLQKQLEKLEEKNIAVIASQLTQNAIVKNGISIINTIVAVASADSLRKLCTDLKSQLPQHLLIIACNVDGKPSVAVALDDVTIATLNTDAPSIIKNHIAKIINGGGGGQKNFAQAGGTDASRLGEVLGLAISLIQ
jgi:alanyl-tRNA synthetase